jgi:hypothetical protein
MSYFANFFRLNRLILQFCDYRQVLVDGTRSAMGRLFEAIGRPAGYGLLARNSLTTT